MCIHTYSNIYAYVRIGIHIYIHKYLFTLMFHNRITLFSKKNKCLTTKILLYIPRCAYFILFLVQLQFACILFFSFFHYVFLPAYVQKVGTKISIRNCENFCQIFWLLKMCLKAEEGFICLRQTFSEFGGTEVQGPLIKRRRLPSAEPWTTCPQDVPKVAFPHA